MLVSISGSWRPKVSLDSICISSASKNHACDIIGVQYILLNFTIRGENFLISYFSLLRPMLKVLALTFYFLVDKDEGGSLCLICKVFLKDFYSFLRNVGFLYISGLWFLKGDVTLSHNLYYPEFTKKIFMFNWNVCFLLSQIKKPEMG